MFFSSLRLWQEANHNGISELTELHTLKQLGLKTSHLDYKKSKKTDQYGNQFKYRAKIKDAHDAQLGSLGLGCVSCQRAVTLKIPGH